jgi:hypothetical protein
VPLGRASPVMDTLDRAATVGGVKADDPQSPRPTALLPDAFGSAATDYPSDRAQSPKRVPLATRVRPSSASLSGPRVGAAPSTSTPQSVEVPSDNDIARMSYDEAKSLVAILEHKLRTARQTVLVRALDQSTTPSSANALSASTAR